ncbi:4Fe-4S dicluster domain-containing protein [Candidatus Neomarinimicrobiota bacterium]
MENTPTIQYQIANVAGSERLRRCIQCGSCTGSCPASYIMDITPREIIANLRAGNLEAIFASRSIWICASCYACTVRCPQQIPVTDIIYLLKRAAIDRKLFPKNFPVYVLSKSFVSLANRYGRSYEPGLILMYYLRSNPLKLFGMIPLMVKLVMRGRVGLLPNKIKSRKALSRIMSEARIMEIVVPVMDTD